MSQSISKGPTTLKLSQQGLLFVAVLLAIEFVFVGGLFHLLTQAETEARREEHLRKVIVTTNRLIELNYVAVFAIRDFVATRDTFHEKKFLIACTEMKGHVDWLEKNLTDQPYQLELVQRVAKRIDLTLDAADRARKVVDGGGSIDELRTLLKSKAEFYQMNKELVPDFQDLMRAQRKIEEKSPRLQRQWRDQAKQFLIAGLILNVVIALAMAVFFTRGIIKRLEVLIDNTGRLKKGETLRPALSGDDEIAKLDRVFHEMASELTESARKERLFLSDARDAESRIRQVIESMPIGLLIVDRTGTILFGNPCAATMFGYSTSDLKGMNLPEVFPESNRSTEYLTALQDEIQGKSKEMRARKKSAVSFDTELSITPFDTKSEKRFLITVTDITERQEIQRMRQAFVAMVSHELRTPLNSVQGFLELLEMGVFGQMPHEAHDGSVRASTNIRRLISLINDLLDLEKMEAGNISLNPQDYDVIETVSRAVESVSDLAERKHVKIVLIADTTFKANFDQDMIIQVVVNLLSNALKFTPDGGVIKVKVERLNGLLEVSVIDEGPGVEPKYREIIFERFQQIRKDNDNASGTGLGLAICKAIVAQHKGTIGVDCPGDRGSRFWFKLDLAPRFE